MTLFGITMVKDEADVIETTLRHHFAEGVEHIIALDHMSTDGTREILKALADEFPLSIVDETDPGYWQSEYMSRLASMAWEQGATWVLPFDADEIFYSTVGGTIADALDGFPAETMFCWGWDHLPVLEGDGSPMHRMPWRRADHQQLAKVCFRASPDAVLNMGNHSVIRTGRRAEGALAYRHFQWRNFEQMVRKVRQGKAAYDATDLHETHGAHWRDLGARSTEELGEEWLRLCSPDGLVYDPAPIRS